MSETLKFIMAILVALLFAIWAVHYLRGDIQKRHEQYLLDGYVASKECMQYQIIYTKGD